MDWNKAFRGWHPNIDSADAVDPSRIITPSHAHAQLVDVGFLVSVTIRAVIPPAIAAASTSVPNPAKRVARGLMLVDTGTEWSAVDWRVLRRLGAMPHATTPAVYKSALSTGSEATPIIEKGDGAVSAEHIHEPLATALYRIHLGVDKPSIMPYGRVSVIAVDVTPATGPMYVTEPPDDGNTVYEYDKTLIGLLGRRELLNRTIFGIAGEFKGDIPTNPQQWALAR